jgi:hypothetical protein
MSPLKCDYTLEDLDMFGFRICLLVALVVAATSVTAAEDYVVPTGVTVLTEEQLLNQIIGSTLVSGKSRVYFYFLPPSGDQKRGRFRGKVTSGTSPGLTSGDWTVNGSLMCWHFDQTFRVAFNGCSTANLDGDTVTWYLPGGTLRYSRYGRISLISGNPENL